LLLLTHPPVYTLGQGANLQFLHFSLEDPSIEWHRVERGGEVTYHGPGQWVGYAILNLRRHTPDLHWYLRQLEQVLIDVLQQLDLQAERLPGLTGVWVEGAKVGAIGIRVSKWISFHGFSLNVCPDLSAFSQIIPCGIADRPVASLQQWIPEIAMDQVEPMLIDCFCRRFNHEAELLPIIDWLAAG
jgi:lipoyl(octanoyl) transferase